jgi:hypothetical protein
LVSSQGARAGSLEPLSNHLALDSCRCGDPPVSNAHPKIAAARILGLLRRALALCCEQTHFFWGGDHLWRSAALKAGVLPDSQSPTPRRVVPVMVNMMRLIATKVEVRCQRMARHEGGLLAGLFRLLLLLHRLRL